MRITELLWDDENQDHIAPRGITEEEVEEVVFGTGVRREQVRAPRFEGPRYLFWGATEAGRALLVVVDPMGSGQGRCVTAREMNAREKSRWRKWQSK